MNKKKVLQDHSKRGFTLIEILVVLFLMSLILGISAVFFGNALPSAKQKAAAKEIAATIKYAKHLADAKNQRQIVIFDLDTGSYGIKGGFTKSIPEKNFLAIYESYVNAESVTKGRYSIYYDSTGGSSWDKINLIRDKQTIQIKRDPILTAVITDSKQ